MHQASEGAGRPWYRRRSVVALSVLFAALIVAVPVAWASDLFGDVPNTNPFHDDIGAVARAGVTKGCTTTTPPNYCPSDPITREAMAAFVHRGFSRVGTSSVQGSSLPANADTIVMSKTITVGLPAGALAGAAQFVGGTGTVSLFASSAASCTTGSPVACYFRVWLTLDGVQISGNNYATFANGQTGMINASTTGVGRVTTSGVHTIAVHVHEYLGAATPSVYGSLSVENAPLGSTGTNVLGGDSSVAGSGAVPGR